MIAALLSMLFVFPLLLCTLCSYKYLVSYFVQELQQTETWGIVHQEILLQKTH